MNADIAGLAVGAVALLMSIVGTVRTGQFLDRLGAQAPPAVVQEDAGTDQPDELQALRTKLEELHTEAMGLTGTYITGMKQLEVAVKKYRDTKARRERIHRFCTRSREFRLLAKGWATECIAAYRLSGADADKMKDIMSRLADDMERLAKSTGGEAGLEGSVAALFDGADSEIKGLIPQEFAGRFRPIPRAWSSGLVANLDEQGK